MRPGPSTRLPILALCALILAGPALAQGGGGGGGGGGTSGGGATGTQGGLPGQAGASSGPTGPGRRAQTEQQLRDAGAAPPPQAERQQLRELNDISRQLGAGGGAVPAPEVEGGGRR